MKNNGAVVKLLITWGIVFFVFAIFIRGVGIFDFEKEQVNLSGYIIGMENMTERQPGKVYEPCNEDACLIMDFGNTSDGGVYGIAMLLTERVAVGKFRAYFGDSIQDFLEEDNQGVYVDKKNNNISMLSSSKARYLKLCINKTIDISKVELIIKKGRAKAYVLSAIVSLLCSCVYIYLRKDRHTKPLEIKRWILHVANRKNIETIIIIVVEMFIICCIEAACYLGIAGVHLNPLRVFMAVCMVAAVTVTVRYKEYFAEHFYVFYFLLVLTAGTINIISPPSTLDLSWDDQIHYARANYLSRAFNGYESEAQYQLNQHSIEMGSMRKGNFTEERRKELAEYIHSIEADSKYDGFRHVQSYKSKLAIVSYVPTAIGLIIGRGVGMSAIVNLLFGKWINLLCYALVLSYSVYLLRRRGYIIVSFIGLIPPAVFLASNYSYDWWLTSLTILGYALLEREIQEKQEVELKAVLKIMVIMFLAILPKPVYFPILIPMLAVCGKQNSKSKKSFWFIIATMVFITALFLIPSLTRGSNLNDTRGSMEVDSFAQIRFILSNPLRYFWIMLKFIGDYISPDHHDITFGFMTEYGEGTYYSVILILIVIGTFADNITWKSEDNGIVRKFKIWTGIGIFAALVLISTAFYVAYTAVMCDTIDGVQNRYGIPLMFPLMYYVCRTNVDIPKKLKDNIAITGCLLMAAVLCYNIYTNCISFY